MELLEYLGNWVWQHPELRLWIGKAVHSWCTTGVFKGTYFSSDPQTLMQLNYKTSRTQGSVTTAAYCTISQRIKLHYHISYYKSLQLNDLLRSINKRFGKAQAIKNTILANHKLESTSDETTKPIKHFFSSKKVLTAIFSLRKIYLHNWPQQCCQTEWH